MERSKSLSAVTRAEVEQLFAKRGDELHRKVENTRDAYFGFIFPVTRDDFLAVARSLHMSADVTEALYEQGKAFSTFRPGGRGRHITNHIVGTAILALRGKELDTGLASVTDQSLQEIIGEHEDSVLEIAEARATWFGRIFFPAAAFSNAMAVFGGKASPNAVYTLAAQYGFAALAGERQTVRGDFGIGVWLTLLGNAP